MAEAFSSYEFLPFILEAEVRKLLHEVSRIAEQALVRARKVREEGEAAVEADHSGDQPSACGQR